MTRAFLAMAFLCLALISPVQNSDCPQGSITRADATSRVINSGSNISRAYADIELEGLRPIIRDSGVLSPLEAETNELWVVTKPGFPFVVLVELNGDCALTYMVAQPYQWRQIVIAFRKTQGAS